VAQALPAADLHLAADVLLDVAAEVAFDLEVLIDVGADLVDLFVGQITDPGVAIELELVGDLLGGRLTDPEDVGERDLQPLLAGDVYAGDSCHVCLLPALSLRSALALLVPGVRADDLDAPVATDHLALLAHLLDARSNLHRGLSFTCSGR
jgi:hypothetical protein